jgi:hypothetical protein
MDYPEKSPSMILLLFNARWVWGPHKKLSSKGFFKALSWM